MVAVSDAVQEKAHLGEYIPFIDEEIICPLTRDLLQELVARERDGRLSVESRIGRVERVHARHGTRGYLINLELC